MVARPRRTSRPSTPNLGLLRLANQRIIGQSWASVADAARGMLAQQGQDFASVKWSLGARVSGVTDTDVEAAFANGSIVRSWPLRGTLHVTASEDLGWMLDLLGSRVVAGVAARRAALSLDEKTLETARDLAIRALSGGEARTRDEMQTLFDAGGISTAGQRGYHILFHLSVTGTLCFGPPRGKEQTFVLLSSWVKNPRRLDRDEALEALARRYFTSHGPATLVDFSGWAKMTARDAKTALSLARRHLIELACDGKTYWMAANAEAILASVKDAEESVVALPGFDELILGYKEREAVLAIEDFEKIVPGMNGVFMPTLVVNGRVKGTWRRTQKTKETLVELTPFTKLSRRERDACLASFARYGRFVGSPVRVVVSGE